MDKIILSNKDIEFIFAWKEKNKDKVRSCRIPLKALKFIFSEQSIVMTAVVDDKENLTLTVNRFGKNIGKIKGKILMEDEGSFICISKNTVDILKILSPQTAAEIAEKATGKRYYTEKDIRDAANDSYTKDLITLYATTMALMVYGVEEINPDNLKTTAKKVNTGNLKKKKNAPKKKKESIIYILSKQKQTGKPVIKAKGSRAKPETSFGVRGHFRHYKNGKVVWINAYVKNKKEGKPLKDKTYKLQKHNSI